MEEIKKCKYCGKPYKLNENIPSWLPEFAREKIKYIPDCDCLELVAKEEEEEREKQRQKECIENRIRKYKSISVVDSKFKKSIFENADNEKYIQLAERYAIKFLEKNTSLGLLFYGNAGTGKTFASSCIANFLMEHGKTVLIINLGLYLEKLKDEYKKDISTFSEQEFLKAVESVDLLIIDDLGTENTTDFTIEKLFNLVDKRYRSEKPLIINTNLSVNFDDISSCGIARYYSKDNFHRIWDRLKGMCFPVRVTGTSKRGTIESKFYEFLS